MSFTKFLKRYYLIKLSLKPKKPATGAWYAIGAGGQSLACTPTNAYKLYGNQVYKFNVPTGQWDAIGSTLNGGKLVGGGSAIYHVDAAGSVSVYVNTNNTFNVIATSHPTNAIYAASENLLYVLFPTNGTSQVYNGAWSATNLVGGTTLTAGLGRAYSVVSPSNDVYSTTPTSIGTYSKVGGPGFTFKILFLWYLTKCHWYMEIDQRILGF
ncbi:hypothetical protein DLAC_11474 [Tieghemostelium lacteum]|uniref:Uncharacterized protein n=1 Tax=Tieghemostelium lacteum TaxID=361077 RepID=A0A152A8E3_TIELA|nr:hypothetical protein DLAC_11474 [Tieghemostelium lacteum]|eukprot:KYR02496.1 hypothetical protein DLAC_11474 [Tieghemostelium lacteum]